MAPSRGQIPAKARQAALDHDQLLATLRRPALGHDRLLAWTRQAVAHDHVLAKARQAALGHDQLLARVRQLPAAPDHLLATVRRLPAAPDHLLATVRRLPAAPDHLLATVRRLPAAPDHLLATVRRLPAAPDHLLATVRHAVAADEQPIGSPKWIVRFRERQQAALRRLGEEGWFFHPEMPATLLHRIDVLLSRYPDEMADWLKGFFRERIGAIERKLTDSYPHRAHLLHDAFEAHRQCKYSLSIPVFMSQADGIFSSGFSRRSLFISRQRKSAAADRCAAAQDGFSAILLHPLLLPMPLWMSESERADSFSGLNRHQVLHGESVQYGTEQNSLKTISLLSYLDWMLSPPGKTEEDG